MIDNNVNPNELSNPKDVENKRALLIEVVSQIEQYQSLRKTWTEGEVDSYLRQIAFRTAEGTIAELHTATPAGFAVDFHERYEMKAIEKLVDERWGAGTFKLKLAQGKLEDVRFYEIVEGNRERRIEPYSYAHPEAMKAEVDFLQQLTKKLGFEFSRLALFLAKPNIWKLYGSSSRSLESFYRNIRTGNIIWRGEGSALADYPYDVPDDLLQEILSAEVFFRAYGNTSSYKILPSDVITRNGFKDSIRN